MAEIRKLRAERQVADALNMRNGPRTDAVHNLPPNSPVLVWREGNTGQAGHWDGPYNLLTVEGETCTVKLPSGPTSFRSTVVKPYLQPESTESDPEIDPETDPKPQESEIDQNRATTRRVDRTAQPPQDATPQPVPKRGRGRPRKYPLLTAMADITIYLQDDATQFSTSRQKELAGLLEKGVFEITKLADVPQGVRLFNSRFVDEIKNPGTDKAFEKSRLVVQAYNDQEKELVLTQSPTIQRVSQRLILCIAAMKPDIRLYLRDISQAYVQSTTNLNREFYVRPPRELADRTRNRQGLCTKGSETICTAYQKLETTGSRPTIRTTYSSCTWTNPRTTLAFSKATNPSALWAYRPMTLYSWQTRPSQRQSRTSYTRQSSWPRSVSNLQSIHLSNSMAVSFNLLRTGPQSRLPRSGNARTSAQSALNLLLVLVAEELHAPH